MAKRIRALSPKKISTVCRCPEAEDGEHECPAIEAQEMIELHRQWESARNDRLIKQHQRIRASHHTTNKAPFRI